MPETFTAEDFKTQESRTFTADDFAPKELTEADLPAEAEALKQAEKVSDMAVAAKGPPIEHNAESLANTLGWAEWMVGGIAHPIKQAETAVEQTTIAAGLAKPRSKLLLSLAKALETPVFGEIPHLPQEEGHGIAATGRKIGRGAINAVIDFANFFQTPEGASLIGTGQLAPVMQKALARTFAVQLAVQAPGQLTDAVEHAQAGNLQEAARSATTGLGGAFMAKTIQEHTLSGGGVTEATLDRLAEEASSGAAREKALVATLPSVGKIKETAPATAAALEKAGVIEPTKSAEVSSPLVDDFQRASEQTDLGAGAAKAVGSGPSQAEISPPVEATPAFKPGDSVEYYSPVTHTKFKGVVTGLDTERGFVSIVNEDGAPVVQRITDVTHKPTQDLTKGGDLNGKGNEEEKGQEEVAPTAAEPTIPSPAKPLARGLSGVRRLNAETERTGPDILDWVANNMRLRSKTDARNAKGANWWNLNSSLYDDAPQRLGAIHHNSIYGGTSMPDQVAQAAFEAGVLKEPSANVLWDEINRASRRRASWGKIKGDENAVLEAKAKEHEALEAENERIGEMERNAPENADTNFLPEEKSAPKLGAGEKGTGELFKGADQPFNLAGESEVDLVRVQREKEAAAKQAEEAKADQAKAQGQLPGTEGSVVRNEPASPDALGVSPLKFSLESISTPAADLGRSVLGRLKTASGEVMPKTTLLNREAGEAGAHYGQSPFYAQYAARALSETILPPEDLATSGLPFSGTEYLAPHAKSQPGIDPAKFGAAITENQLRGRRNALRKLAAAEPDPLKKADLLNQANNVRTVVGRFKMFRNEAELQKFVQDPEVIAKMKQAVDLYEQHLDPLAKQAGLDITKKPEDGGLFPFKVFWNLFVPHEGGMPSRATVKTRLPADIPKAGPVTTGAGGAKLTATLKKMSRLALQRSGASDIYGVDFHDMTANAFGGFTEIARKNEFDKALVDSGLAKIQQERPGAGWKFFPYERTRLLGLEEGSLAWKKTVNNGIWVKDEIAREYETVSNVTGNPARGTAMKLLTGVVNKFQMLGVLDATFHSTALLRRLWEAPLGKADTAMGVLRPLTVPRRLMGLAANIFEERITRNEKLAELANIGALTGHGQLRPEQIVKRTVNFIEENVRLTLNDFYDHLIKEGYPDNETARREYINAGLQYNKRFHGPVMQQLRNWGVGPFAVAGRAGLARGVRRWFLQDWVPGQDPAARAWTMANVATKMAGTALLVGVLNHLITGKWGGRNGTRIGSVDTGQNDEKTGRPLEVPLSDLMGSEMRGARALGLRAVFEGLRDHAPLNQVIDAAARDSFAAIVHPLLGPAMQAAYGAATGRPISPVAPDYPAAPPGKSQFVSNVKHAAEELNPMLMRGARNVLASATSKVAPAEEGPLERVKGVVLRPGQKPMEPKEKEAMIHGSQLNKYVASLASEARKLPILKRGEYVQARLKADEISPADRAEIMKDFGKKGVFKYK